MDIDLDVLEYDFLQKPLLVGGKAMEYYGLRKAGGDIDLIISQKDYENLIKKYPDNKKDIYGDLGIIVYGFEIWRTIRWFNYDFYTREAIEKEHIKIVSLEKLLFMKALASDIEKYRKDLQLLIKKINWLSWEEREHM